jgi:hypothetical protein
MNVARTLQVRWVSWLCALSSGTTSQLLSEVTNIWGKKRLAKWYNAIKTGQERSVRELGSTVARPTL